MYIHFVRVYFAYPFICWRIFGVLPLWGSCGGKNLSMCPYLHPTILGRVSSIEYWSCYGNFLFSFLRNCQTTFCSGKPSYTPNSSSQGLQFSHILTNTCSFLHFLKKIIIFFPEGVKWWPQCGLGFVFP